MDNLHKMDLMNLMKQAAATIRANGLPPDTHDPKGLKEAMDSVLAEAQAPCPFKPGDIVVTDGRTFNKSRFFAMVVVETYQERRWMRNDANGNRMTPYDMLCGTMDPKDGQPLFWRLDSQDHVLWDGETMPAADEQED